jgi:hypothetical protein
MLLSLLYFFIIIKSIAEAPAILSFHQVSLVGHTLLGLVFVINNRFGFIANLIVRLMASSYFLFVQLFLLNLSNGVIYDIFMVLLSIHRILFVFEAFLLDLSGKEAPVTDYKELHKVDKHCEND